MRILVLSDGRPGHFKQSRGVLQAIERVQPIEVEWADVGLRLGIFRDVLRLWLNRSQLALPPARLSLFYKMPALSTHRPDLIISAGGKTSFANAWLARWYGCQNIFIGTLRGLNERLFTKIVTLDENKANDAGYIVSLLPTNVDRQQVEREAAEYQQANGLGPHRRWTLLIGGPCRGYGYSQTQWHRLVGSLKPLADKYGIHWLISTSRRTGTAVEQMLEPLRNCDFVDDLLLFNRDERRLFNAFLGSAECVFCTEDSAMMLSEAVASGRPVFALRPPRARPGKNNRKLLNLYENQGFIERLEIDDWINTSFANIDERFANLQEAPMQGLCQQIEQFVKAA